MNNFVYKMIMMACLVLIFFNTKIQLMYDFNNNYGPSIVNDHRMFYTLIFIYCLTRLVNFEKKY